MTNQHDGRHRGGTETAETDTRADEAVGPPAVDDPILDVRNASVRFQSDRGESTVLDDVSLSVRRNEILGVVGESGSGKSMFADALLDAIIEPGTLDGEIVYYPESDDAVDVLSQDDDELRSYRWEEVSMVFQGAQDAFNPTTTIRTHFEETLSAHDADGDAGMERARELLTDVYLDPDRVLDSYPHELSGGMKQRTLIALSLVLEPSVLVLDEPTAALDLLMQRSIIALLEDLQAKYDLTIVFITHDLPLVATMADRLAVMYSFQFVELGPTDAILDDARHPYTRALLNATPDLNSPVDRMEPIEGKSPDPVNQPSGCSYADRCPIADEDLCTGTEPPLETVDTDHVAACHFPEEATDAIPAVTDHS